MVVFMFNSDDQTKRRHADKKYIILMRRYFADSDAVIFSDIFNKLFNIKSYIIRIHIIWKRTKYAAMNNYKIGTIVSYLCPFLSVDFQMLI